MGNEMIVEAKNLVHAKEGDRVVISFDTTPLLKATFLIYLFPVLCMLAGAGIGHVMGPKLDFDSSAAAAVCGFLSFFTAIGYMKRKGNKMAGQDEYKPKIIRVTLGHAVFAFAM